jgi:hypothetical protein
LLRTLSDKSSTDFYSVETLPEAGAERAVVDGAADLEQPVGATP